MFTEHKTYIHKSNLRTQEMGINSVLYPIKGKTTLFCTYSIFTNAIKEHNIRVATPYYVSNIRKTTPYCTYSILTNAILYQQIREATPYYKPFLREATLFYNGYKKYNSAFVNILYVHYNLRSLNKGSSSVLYI